MMINLNNNTMKNLTLILIFLLPITVFCQKIKKSEIDKFNKSYRIETNDVYIKSGLSNVIMFGLHSVDNSVYIKLYGNGDLTHTVYDNDQLIFLASNDSTILAFSKSTQTPSYSGRNLYFEYFYRISLSELKKLIEYDVISFRMIMGDRYGDMDISESARGNLKRCVSVFLDEYDKVFHR